MAENRTITSIAAQAVCDKLPLPAYGFHFNPAMPLTIPKPACAWAVHAPMRIKAVDNSVDNASNVE